MTEINFPNESGQNENTNNHRNRTKFSNASGPSNRRDVEPKDNSQNRSDLCESECVCLPKQIGCAAPQAIGNLTANQIVSRNGNKDKLSNFSGDPSEWLLWHHEFKSTTELCGYSNGENLNRLKKSLQGKAKTDVYGLLLHPDAVPTIIEMLRTLYGRPESIIKTITGKIRDHAMIKPDSLDDLMSFAFEVNTITTTIELLNSPTYLTDPSLIEELVNKLPIQEKKDWAHYTVRLPKVTLRTLSDWLHNLAMILRTLSTPTAAKKSNDRKTETEKFDKNEKANGLELVNVHLEKKDNNRLQNSESTCIR